MVDSSTPPPRLHPSPDPSTHTNRPERRPSLEITLAYYMCAGLQTLRV